MKKNKLFLAIRLLFLLVLPAATIGYLMVINFMPLKASYYLKVGENDSVRGENLKLDPYSLSEPVSDGGFMARSFILSYAQLYFSPDVRLWPEHKLSIKIFLKSEADLELAVDCKDCGLPSQSSRYQKSFALYKKELNDFQKIAGFNGVNVYADPSLIDYPFKQGVDFLSWLKANLDLLSEISIGTIDYDINPGNFPMSHDIDAADKEIQLNIRGDVDFVIYGPADIDLAIFKKDLNWYPNPEPVMVKIFDSNHLLISEKEIPDDQNKDVIQSVRFQLKQPHKGLYFVEITGPENNGQKDNDFLIPKIIVNTDKILLSGDVITGGKISYYYESKNPISVRVTGWTNDNIQPLLIDGVEQFSIIEEDLRKWKTIELPAGEHLFSSRAWLRIDMMNNLFAPQKDYFFQPYQLNINNYSPQIIFTPLDIDNSGNGWNEVTLEIPLKPLLDFWGTPVVKELKFIIYAPERSETFQFEKNLKEAGYKYMAGYGDIHIYSLGDLENGLHEIIPAGSYQDWMKQNIPLYSAVGVEGFYPDINDFTNDFQEDTKSSGADFKSIALRPPLELMLYGDRELSVSIGSMKDFQENDTIKIELADLNDEVIDSRLFKLDENKADDQDIIAGIKSLTASFQLPKKGLYKLNISNESDKSPTITDISFSSSKVILSGLADFASPQEFYTKVDNDMEVKWIYSGLNPEDDLIRITRISDNTDLKIKLSESAGKGKFALAPGEYTIRFPGDIKVESPLLAVDKNSFFKPYMFDFGPRDFQDFIVIKKSIPSIKLSDVLISLE